MRKRLLSILVLIPFVLIGQNHKGMNISSNLFYGNIIKHRRTLAYQKPAYVSGVSLCFSQRTLGSKQWQYFHRYPELGFGVAYFDLGDKKVLGETIGLLTQISYNMYETSKASINGEIAIGVGYVSKHYDVISNPTNNAIGSSINNITIVKLNFGYDVNSKFSISSAAAITHLSNGALKLPNLGINVFQASIGLTYHLNPVLRKEDFIIYDKSKNDVLNKFGLQVQYNFGVKAAKIGGDLFGVTSTSIKGVYRKNKILKWQLGFAHEFRNDIYNGLLEQQVSNPKSAKMGARRFVLLVAQELVFDRLGFFGETGIYLQKNTINLEQPFYFKVGARYYLPIKSCFYIEGYIKTHLFTGDHFAIGMGVEF